ncbi:hypothetical protein [Chelatococcus sp. XZ-Ab1]|uniref:hypothetical protein n=1 Tax=Chelatococcus sp. XZ-Ab1 TaxID=3034027 RepID=UPI0023E3C460|nr:hypothetical protein [Chelatococcus sp. XZ-Ab1]
MPEQLYFGAVPVPYTASWSAEEGTTHVAPCRWASGRPALCQAVARGEGKPLFGKPHAQRQRQAIVDGLCDLCGRPLKNCTKVSLSHARTHANGAHGLANLQVEPLLHRECAATSARLCPSLRRDLRDGAIEVRQVTRFRVQIAVIAPQFIAEYVPGYRARPDERIAGHAKVELIKWKDRTADWLLAGLADLEAA